MKKYVVTVLALLLLQVCCSLLCGRSCGALTLTESEQAWLDNITSGGSTDNAGSDSAYSTPPSYDAWYLDRMRRFPFFYYDPYYSFYHPYADPYPGAYGYPWRYYDDDHHDHDRHGSNGRSGSVRRQRQNRWENFQSFMLDRRENRLERAENIRDSLQDLFSRERSFGVQDNRRDDFGTRLPVREHRGMDTRGRDSGNWLRGGRR